MSDISKKDVKVLNNVVCLYVIMLYALIDHCKFTVILMKLESSFTQRGSEFSS